MHPTTAAMQMYKAFVEMEKGQKLDFPSSTISHSGYASHFIFIRYRNISIRNELGMDILDEGFQKGKQGFSTDFYLFVAVLAYLIVVSLYYTLEASIRDVLLLNSVDTLGIMWGEIIIGPFIMVVLAYIIIKPIKKVLIKQKRTLGWISASLILSYLCIQGIQIYYPFWMESFQNDTYWEAIQDFYNVRKSSFLHFGLYHGRYLLQYILVALVFWKA